MRRDRSAIETRMRSAFQANAADLLAYAERRVLPRADAADVISEAMVTAWRKVHSLPEDPQQARMWLFAVVKNTLSNHRRSAARRNAAVESLRALISTNAEDDNHERLETELQVRAALAAIPPELAELVRLVVWDGLSLADAAQLQRLPPSTIRSRYAKARELLADALADAREETSTPGLLERTRP